MFLSGTRSGVTDSLRSLHKFAMPITLHFVCVLGVSFVEPRVLTPFQQKKRQQLSLLSLWYAIRGSNPGHPD